MSPLKKIHWAFFEQKKESKQANKQQKENPKQVFKYPGEAECGGWDG